MNKSQTLHRYAFGAITIIGVLLAVLIITPHITHAQSIFGYGGGGRLPRPIPPNVADLLANLAPAINNFFIRLLASIPFFSGNF